MLHGGRNVPASRRLDAVESVAVLYCYHFLLRLKCKVCIKLEIDYYSPEFNMNNNTVSKFHQVIIIALIIK